MQLHSVREVETHRALVVGDRICRAMALSCVQMNRKFLSCEVWYSWRKSSIILFRADHYGAMRQAGESPSLCGTDLTFK